MRLLLVPLLFGGTPAMAHAVAGAPTPDSRQVADRVVAVVNEAIILDSTLAARTRPQLAALDSVADAAERARRAAQIRAATLDELINEELVVQAGEQANLDVDATEVQTAIVEIERQNDVTDTQLTALLAQQNVTFDDYKADVRRQLLRLRAINAIVAPKVTVSDADVLARYTDLQRRSPTAPKPLPEMQAQIAGELRHRELDRQTRLWLDELRKDAYIELTP